jgi:hypothetical protein
MSIWSSLENAISTLGINEVTSAAIARAYASPSLSNIAAVENAFIAAGTTVPPEILALLQQRYAAAVQAYPSVYAQSGVEMIGQALPWIIGGVALFLFMRKGK